MPISAEILESCGIAAIHLHGDLTTSAAHEIENLFSNLSDKGANRILLNLEKVQSIDIQAVSILVRLVVTLRTRGGELRIVNAKGKVLEILGHRSFRRFFGLCPTIEKALGALTAHDLRSKQRRQQKTLAARFA